MKRYTMKQRVLIVEHYNQNNENLLAMIRKLRPIIGRNNKPNSSAVRKIVVQLLI